MVAPLIPLLAIGGAAIAGGGITAARAAKTKGTGVDRGFGRFGGSPEASAAFGDATAAGMGAGMGQIGEGERRLNIADNRASQFGQMGQGLVGDGRTRANVALGRANAAGNSLLNFQSKAPNMGAAVGQRTLDRGAQQAIGLAGLARGGNVGGALSQAQAANSAAAQQAAQDAQITAAQQQMAAEQMQLNAQQAGGQQLLGVAGAGHQQMGMGLGAQQFGIGMNAERGSALLNAGMSREANYLNALQNQMSVEAQLQADMEKHRADGARQKRDRLFGFAGALTGGGFQAMGAGMGGGGG